MSDDLTGAAERGRDKQGPRNLSDELADDEADQQEEETDTTRFTIDLPDSLHQQLKVQAAKEGRSMKAVVMESVRNYLSD